MAKGVFVKTIGGLRAADDDAEEILSKWRLGDARMVDVTKPRNLKAHRYYWAMVGIVYRNQETYPSREALSDVIKLGAGHVETLIMPDGTAWLRPKSISFTAQDDPEFLAFLDRAKTFIITRLLPGLDLQALTDEIDYLVR